VFVLRVTVALLVMWLAMHFHVVSVLLIYARVHYTVHYITVWTLAIF